MRSDAERPGIMTQDANWSATTHGIALIGHIDGTIFFCGTNGKGPYPVCRVTSETEDAKQPTSERDTKQFGAADHDPARKDFFAACS